jgi:hypothetical protein
MSMTNLYSNYGQAFVEFDLRREDARSERSSLAGAPPLGVRPAEVFPNTRHLATLGLEEGIDVTLFSTFDYSSKKNSLYFFDAIGRLYDQSNVLIQFVLHSQIGRVDLASSLRNEIPALALMFGKNGVDPECPTIDDLGNAQIYAGHKVGGMPFFSQLEGEIEAALRLLSNGYVHLLQLAFPSNRDSLAEIRADWPFGESVFHVFARKAGSSYEFRYIWG